MLNEDDILFELEKITDEMTFDSDVGGDSDAEDVLPASHSSSISSLTIEGIEDLNSNEPCSDFENNDSRNPHSITGKKRNLRSQKPSSSMSITNLNEVDSITTDSLSDCIQSPLISSPIHMATNYTDWDTSDVIDDTNTDKTYVPKRALSQDDDSDSSDSELIEDDQYPVFDFCKTGKIPEQFSSATFNETQGPIDPLYSKKSIIDIWESIFLPIVDIIVVESNI